MTIIKSTLLFMALTTSVLAGAGSPVSHSHGGRSHSHPLPAEGMNHSHGGGSSKAPQNNSSDDGWVFAASSGSGSSLIKHYAKQGSLSVNNGKASAIFKVETKDDIYIEKVVVALQHCRNEAGVFSLYTLGGKLRTTHDFAFGAGSVGSAKAEFVCNSALK